MRAISARRVTPVRSSTERMADTVTELGAELDELSTLVDSLGAESL